MNYLRLETLYPQDCEWRVAMYRLKSALYYEYYQNRYSPAHRQADFHNLLTIYPQAGSCKPALFPAKIVF